MKRQLFALPALALGAALLASSPAAAVPPETREFSSEIDFVTTDGCGEGIDLASQILFEFSVREFLDADGEIVRTNFQVTFDITLTRSDTGRSLTSLGRYVVQVDFRAGERSVSGATFRVEVPGEGVVYQDVGREVFSLEDGEVLFAAGPNADQSLNNFACEYLA